MSIFSKKSLSCLFIDLKKENIFIVFKRAYWLKIKIVLKIVLEQSSISENIMHKYPNRGQMLLHELHFDKEKLLDTTFNASTTRSLVMLTLPV